MGSSRQGRHPTSLLLDKPGGNPGERGLARSLADALSDILRAEHDLEAGSRNHEQFSSSHVVRAREPVCETAPTPRGRPG